MIGVIGRHRRLVAIFGSVGINVFLLALIPLFFQIQRLPKKMPAYNPVAVWLPDRRPEPEPEKKPVKPQPQKKLRLKPLLIKSFSTKVTPRIKIDLPALNIELAPQMIASVPVPAMAESWKSLYRAEELDQQPASMANPAPLYPPAARRRGISGWVKVRFKVDSQGRVRDIVIVEAKPPGFFERTVRSTLSHWHFRPGMVRGKAVNTEMETTIVFKLEK